MTVYTAAAISFVLVYSLATWIKTGKARFSDALRLVVGVTVFGFGSSVVVLPVVAIVYMSEFGFWAAIWYIILVYVLAAVLVILLSTLLSWLNDSSPIQELWDSVNQICGSSLAKNGRKGKS